MQLKPTALLWADSLAEYTVTRNEVMRQTTVSTLHNGRMVSVTGSGVIDALGKLRAVMEGE